MIDLIDRLKHRRFQMMITSAYAGNIASAAYMQPQTGTITIDPNKPDADIDDAIKRIEALEAVVGPARELLYLYDWRPLLAKHEADPHVDQKWLKKQLREYGERKKAGWVALRAALEKVSA